MCVARFNLIQKKAKENAELVLKAKGGNPDGKLPFGTLLDVKSEDGDKSTDVGTFLALKKIDSENEKFPVEIHKRHSLKGAKRPLSKPKDGK